jgi:hypothetical protein
MVKYEDTLKCKFPQIAEEWDYKSNADLKPEDISAGSHRAVWWICKNCGKSYYQIIYNRTSRKSKKCPICQGRVIKQGYNSLKAKYPTIVEREWDYALNTENPDLIAPHTKKKYWWLCPNGHESYLSCPNNKVIGNGGKRTNSILSLNRNRYLCI